MNRAEFLSEWFTSDDFHAAATLTIRVAKAASKDGNSVETALKALLTKTNVKKVIQYVIDGIPHLRSEDVKGGLFSELMIVPRFLKEVCPNHGVSVDGYRTYGKSLSKYVDHTHPHSKFVLCTGHSNVNLLKLAQTSTAWHNLLANCMYFKLGVSLMCLYGRIFENIIYFYKPGPVNYKNVYNRLEQTFSNGKKKVAFEDSKPYLKSARMHFIEMLSMLDVARQESAVCNLHAKDAPLKDLNGPRPSANTEKEGRYALKKFFRRQKDNDVKYGTVGLTEDAIYWGKTLFPKALL